MEGFKILKEINYSILIQLTNLSSPLILLPLLFDKFGSFQYAEYARGLVFSYFFCNLFINGLGTFFTRLYIASDGAYEVLNKIRGAQIFLAIIGFFVLSFLLFLLKFESLYFILSMMVLISAFNFEWLLYAKQELKFLFFRSFVHKLVLFIGLFFLFERGGDIFYYCLYHIVSFFIFYTSGYLKFFSALSVFKVKFDLNFLKEAKYFLGSNIIGSCQMWGDQIIVGFLLSNESYAILNICRQIISALVSVSVAICRILMNKTLLFLSNSVKSFEHVYARAKRYLLIYFSFVILSAILFIFVCDYIVGYVSNYQIELSVESILICSLTFIVTSILIYIDTQISIPLHKERYTFISNIFVCGFIVIFTYPLSYFFDVNGALSALLIAEAIGLSCVMYLHFNKRGVR